MKRWAAKNKVELCFTPTYASWANPVEAHFGPLRQFTLANSNHPHITPRIARKGIEPSQRLGRHRWTMERTVAWLAGCRRLHRGYERKAEHFLAFADRHRGRAYAREPVQTAPRETGSVPSK
jgi:hypothetical protein